MLELMVISRHPVLRECQNSSYLAIKDEAHPQKNVPSLTQLVIVSLILFAYWSEKSLHATATKIRVSSVRVFQATDHRPLTSIYRLQAQPVKEEESGGLQWS